GLIKTDENFQTAQSNIYAVGDVIGFPGLASTSMSQARIAVLHAFDKLESEAMPIDLPLGIWTIPAVSMVGKTEEELTDACIPYEIGIAHFKEISRAHIMGEEEGILKLLFDPETLKILGVHIIGPRASELIHLGHSVMFFEGTIKYFMNTVFNSPTLDEAYRVAAFNGMNRLNHESI
ncbi:MAG: Si-specific NAD(P)(+) transhydrogenase, partial [SAR324 cluster bacterium]|nr:Si-specific NAD(P)(+) transhydrogenase [SAR324 cluster bacterium]